MTPDQKRLANLRRANAIRSERRELKARLATREVLLDDLLEAPPPCILTATVFEVITWAPGFGRRKAEAALRRLREPDGRTVGALSKRRRLELIDLLGRHNGRALRGAAYADYLC